MANIPGTTGDDILSDTGGNDTVTASGGNDTITVSEGGTDAVDGGTGSDRLVLDARKLGGGVSLPAPTQSADGLSGSASWSGAAISFQRVEHFTIFTHNSSAQDNVTTGGGDDVFHHTPQNFPTYLLDFVNLGAGTDTLVGDFSGITFGAVALGIGSTDGDGHNGLVTVNGFGKVQYTGVDRFEITGSDLADTLTGGDGADILGGGLGNDTVNGRGGADTLVVARGTDQLNGGAGVDTLVLNWGGATTAIAHYSGPGANETDGGWDGQIYGGSSDLYAIYTSIERFNITTGSGNDDILTKSGDDVVSTGSGNDLVNVGTGIDRADGGDGTDSISADLSDAAGAIVWDLAANSFSGGPDSFANFEYFGTITTAGGDDVITTSAIDKNETINLGAGNDVATVVRGTDYVNGGTGNDTLIVDWAAATARVYAYVGPNPNGTQGGWDGQFYGGSSSFYVHYSSIDRFLITTGSGSDEIVTANGDDVVITGSGDDSVDVRSGTDRADGGDGVDKISADLSDANGAIVWNLVTNSYSGGPDTFSNFEYFGTITTAGGDDVITTSALNKDETLNLGGGNDTATIVRGTDRVNGGTGNDTLVIDWAAATAAVISFVAPGANTVEGGWDGQYYGGSSSFYAHYSSINRFLITTGSGNDDIVTANGDDVVNTGSGDDIVDVRPTSATPPARSSGTSSPTATRADPIPSATSNISARSQRPRATTSLRRGPSTRMKCSTWAPATTPPPLPGAPTA
jgi:Ca2+-binding RTX toxin-like protein